ncbi:MAG: cell division protein ZapA [Pseudomonadota bacterium]
MPSVNVMINGKNYRMACDDGQETHLKSLAEAFDARVNNLKGAFGEIGDQRLTVMAGVMLTDEMQELQKKVDGLQDELAQLQESGALQSREKQAGDGELAKSIDTIAKTIEQLNKKLGV